MIPPPPTIQALAKVTLIAGMGATGAFGLVLLALGIRSLWDEYRSGTRRDMALNRPRPNGARYAASVTMGAMMRLILRLVFGESGPCIGCGAATRDRCARCGRPVCEAHGETLDEGGWSAGTWCGQCANRLTEATVQDPPAVPGTADEEREQHVARAVAGGVE